MNTQVQNEIRDALKLQLGVDKTPNVVPVIEVNPKIIKNGLTTSGQVLNATSHNSFTSSTQKDTYVTAVSLSYTKDATNTATYIYLQCILNGEGKRLINLAVLASTAQQDSLSISFPHPIKIDRGTIVSIGTDNATATIRMACTVSYFEDEYSNA